jgi:hypothetical protein
MRLALALAAGLLSLPALADRLPDPAAVRALSDKAMAQVGSGRVDEGLRLLKPYSAAEPAEFDGLIAQVNKQMPAMEARFGKVVGHEWVREDRAGESLLQMSYLQKYELSGIRWVLRYYHSPTGWLLDSMTFDPQVELLYDNRSAPASGSQ